MTAFRLATPRRATFAFSGIPSRDNCSLVNTKRALVNDAQNYLRSVIAQNADEPTEATFDVTDRLEVLESPTLAFEPDNSVIRTSGLATLTVVVTAHA